MAVATDLHRTFLQTADLKELFGFNEASITPHIQKVKYCLTNKALSGKIMQQGKKR